MYAKSKVKNHKAAVIIATYNRGKHLSELINTLLNQTCKDFIIIIVDDGSTDRTEEIVKKYIQRYPNELKYFFQENKGLSTARNKGIEESGGDILIFLDDDAQILSDYVESHLKAYANNRKILGLRGKALPKDKLIYNYFQAHYDLGDKAIPTLIPLEGNSSYRRDVLLEVGGFNPNLFGGEGNDLIKRICTFYKNDTCLFYCPDAVIYHNYADTFWDLMSKTYRYGKEKGKEVAQKYWSISSLFPKNEIEELFVPSVIYWWRIYKKEHWMAFWHYLWGVFTSSAYIWVKKVAEILGYLKYKYGKV